MITDNTHDNRPLFKMFNQVPQRYDLLNRLLTMRFDEGWRRKAARACLENNPTKVLDLCTGTGDLAISISRQSNPPAELTGLDFSSPMLDIAKTKSRKKATGPIKFLLGDASDMPFEDKHFNAVGIAFAFRNLTFHNPLREQCLAEVHRVLDEGGRFVIIESSQPKYKVLRQFWLFYIKVFVKPVGSWISGHRGAYNYLSHSVQHYYQAEEIKDMLISTGFTRVEFQTLMGGVAALHIAYK
ncbi:MAG: bifunctional demethylmenaquinone methyltransferase/2-methoxy-6-polyprenyl-1,4-benzoquinol methylase UbiE [Bacteroidota bacterium]|nr:bifunctional demethylmenaquinone methyltransferase/2-methoxy-6-polyprenyl-1,4-benzoquinol methylase UbiE [Bacteroidota bacterium]